MLDVTSGVMKWATFHHPKWSLPVIKRRASLSWLEMLDVVGPFLAGNLKAMFWQHTFPSQNAYRSAISRLKKAGVIAWIPGDGGFPTLRLTDKGKERLPVELSPVKRWNTKWNGIWYTLFFDVPEAHRTYRTNLTNYLRKLRMGCLQKSVWITPFDIRPEYDDLTKGAGVTEVAYMFESRLVLDRRDEEIVHDAWDIEQLSGLQKAFIKTYSDNMEMLDRPGVSGELLTALAVQEMDDYLAVMSKDPLLPTSLCPTGYKGGEVYDLHTRLRVKIARTLANHCI